MVALRGSCCPCVHDSEPFVMSHREPFLPFCSNLPVSDNTALQSWETGGGIWLRPQQLGEGRRRRRDLAVTSAPMLSALEGEKEV